MDDKPSGPKSLQEAVVYFADPDVAFAFAVELRWPTGVICPFCNSTESSFLSTRKVWKCKGCKKQFSVRVGTIFEDSPISLSKWFVAIWMIANCKNGISSYELHRAIRVTQKTAWFMLHRIRLAMKAKSFDKKLAGVVEADETFIGGLLGNMHQSKRGRLMKETIEEREKKAKGKNRSQARRVRTGKGPVMGKTIVQAVLQRDGEVRAQIIENLDTLRRIEFMREHIKEGSQVMTDTGNASIGRGFFHRFVNHQIEYVRGNVHTNSVENFWSLLKRTLRGTYVSVEPYHLSAYVDEQSFRFNNRQTNDGSRFLRALASTKGCRLTYKTLIRAEQA